MDHSASAVTKDAARTWRRRSCTPPRFLLDSTTEGDVIRVAPPSIIATLKSPRASEIGSTRGSAAVTIVVPGASCAVDFFAGGLIHTAIGKSASRGWPLTKRSGCVA
jgi:hypothetical protein